MLARDLGVSISAVTQRRRQLGIARSPEVAGFVWTAAADRILGKKTDREVAQELGISQVTVERRRIALDIPGAQGRGNRKRPAELAGAQYVRAYRAGGMIADIAREHGLSHSTVSKALRRYLRRVEGARGSRRARSPARAAP